MKILIDIGHPAHVHYFRNFIQIMQNKGHEFIVTARDKEVSIDLLHHYKIAFYNRGKGRVSLLGKVFYLIWANFKLLTIAFKNKPEIAISFGTPYAAQISKLYGIPHIGLTDTEHAKLGILSFAPFSDAIITPSSYQRIFGDKQIKFNGFFELCYLHPKYYRPNTNIKEELMLSESDKFVLLRFISWNASHDIGQSGISLKTKIDLVQALLYQGFEVLISSEGLLPPDLQKYKIRIPPSKIHDVLASASLFIGESGTMATEAALLGTPSVYVNSLDAGVFNEEVEYGLLYSFRTDDNLIEKISSIIQDTNLKEKHIYRKNKMLADKIDVTTFLVWFVENYPASHKLMKSHPEYQLKFK